MKILIIWAESIERHTGGSVHFWGLTHGIKSIGWQVRAIVPAYGRRKTPNVENISFVSLPRRCLFSFLLLQAATVLYMPHWLIKHRPGVVYVRACFLAFLMHPICWIAGVPLIIEVDAIVDEEIKMRGQLQIMVPILKVLDRLNYRSVDGVVCVTSGIREEVIRRGAKLGVTVTIHNAPQTDIMRPIGQDQARQQLGLHQAGYIVGFAGSFAPWQGLDMLVQAARQVIDNLSKPVLFVLAGEGQFHQKLRGMIEQFALQQFFLFLAPMPYREVAVFYNACDMIVCPRYDPRTLRYGMSSLKFWDAISVGVPVLIPQGSGLEDILEHIELPGIFHPGDKRHLAEAILRVLAQTEHHQSRRKEVHKIVSEEYSWKRAAERLSELCLQLTKKK